MTRADDELREKIHDLALKQALDEAEHEKEKAVAAAVKAGEIKLRARDWWWIKKLIGICLVMWCFVYGGAKSLGGFLYANSDVVKAGVDAAVTAWWAKHG